MLLDSHRSEPLLALSCGLLWVISALCFLRGTYEFSERRMPRAWYAVAGGCSALAFVLGIGPSGAPGMLPLVLFQSVGLLTTGALMLRSAQRRAGAWLCGVDGSAARVWAALGHPASSHRHPRRR